MINTEKCIDVLPYAVDIFEKLELAKYIREKQISVLGKSKEEIEELGEEAGFKFLSHICRNITTVKEELFNFVAVLQEKSVEEVKAQPIGETLKVFKEVLSNTEAVTFFKLAMK